MPATRISTRQQLEDLVEEIGFLPLFPGSLPGFSAQAFTAPEAWFTGDEETDPWQWRQQIAADGRLVYGKLLEKKAAFVSRKWYPVLAALRRDGYDFDTRYECGLAQHRQKKIMDLLADGQSLPAHRLRAMAGFGAGGETGFDGVLATLQAQTYVVIRGMHRKVSKAGQPYGWPVSVYSTPEALLGAGFADPWYEVPPAKLYQQLDERLALVAPQATPAQRAAFLK